MRMIMNRLTVVGMTKLKLEIILAEIIQFNTFFQFRTETFYKLLTVLCKNWNPNLQFDYFHKIRALVPLLKVQKSDLIPGIHQLRETRPGWRLSFCWQLFSPQLWLLMSILIPSQNLQGKLNPNQTADLYQVTCYDMKVFLLPLLQRQHGVRQSLCRQRMYRAVQHLLWDHQQPLWLHDLLLSHQQLRHHHNHHHLNLNLYLLHAAQRIM